MRVFVAEYVCGGGLANTDLAAIPSNLRREGVAMAKALACDTSAVAEVVMPVDARLFQSMDDLNSVDRIELSSAASVWNQWLEIAVGCDAAIMVAPEKDGILAQGVAMLRAGGIDVIASSGDFLRVASDKVQTAKVLTGGRVNHPRYLAAHNRRQRRRMGDCDRYVVKPRDGCGTEAIQIYTNLDEAIEALDERSILQEWTPGRPISVSLIADGNSLAFLPAVSQNLSPVECEYVGGAGPLCEDDQRRATALAARAISVMPPTARGFLGLDLVLGERPSEDFVIEINPRLTTSYVGLRKMVDANLAARILGTESGPITCNVDVQSVCWTSDGEVTTNQQSTTHSDSPAQ